MPLSSSLSPGFLLWAASKMRGLVEARHNDSQAGLRHLPSFFSLLDATMLEYDSQPFAQPDITGHDGCDPSDFLPAESMRERAMDFLLMHAAPGGVPRIGLDALSPLPPPGPHELWAMSETQHLRALTCTAVGIPVDTSDADLPAAFAPQYDLLVQREFDLLSDREKSLWLTLASDRQFALERGETDLIAVQNRQLELFPWFAKLVDMEMTARFGGLIMTVSFHGFAVGAEDLLVHTYRGQASSYEGAASWHRSRPYREYVKSLWVDFVNREVEGSTIDVLPRLPDVCPAHLVVYRSLLKTFFEEMIRLQCGMDVLDKKAFWLEVAADPTAFVSPERLPNHIVFANPEDMPEDDFRAVYDHVWCCHVDRIGMPSAERFVYQPSILARYIARDSAISLQAHQSRSSSSSSPHVSASEVTAIAANPALAAHPTLL